jgi:hypothetical protein
MSDSEEDEYNNTGMVYDSENSDEDFDSEDEELVINGNFFPNQFLSQILLRYFSEQVQAQCWKTNRSIFRFIG